MIPVDPRVIKSIQDLHGHIAENPNGAFLWVVISESGETSVGGVSTTTDVGIAFEALAKSIESEPRGRCTGCDRIARAIAAAMETYFKIAGQDRRCDPPSRVNLWARP